MAEAAKTYRVGRGKPPQHTQFQKGQSGNPSGKAGPDKAVKARLKESVLELLDRTSVNEYSTSSNLESIAKGLALAAMRGNTNAMKFLIELVDEPAAAQQEIPEEDESGTFSLPQGKTQGRFESPQPESDQTLAAQGFAATAPADAGKMAGNRSPQSAAPDIVAGQADRPGN